MATHATGDWAVIFLLLSLAMTPARALFDWMPLVHIRRRIGVAAACYAGAHFLIYVLDQKWNLIVVATEIAKRFYLTIGFVTLLMLVALAVTSTDGWQKRLKRNWKRLHWLIYPAAFIALVHFFIQSKLKIGEPAFAAGLFAWLMLWRVLPVKLRTRFTGLALLAVGATLAAVLFETAWYGLVNGIDPIRVLAANLDPELAPRPALKVLIASLLVMLLVALRRLAPRCKQALDETLYPVDYIAFLREVSICRWEGEVRWVSPWRPAWRHKHVRRRRRSSCSPRRA